MSAPPCILGIETSCDETAVALVATDERGAPYLRGESVYSQIETHARWGGVVPELASRDHVRKLAPMVAELLARTQTPVTQLTGIAYTAGPGLIGALLVGAAVAQGLALGWNLPVIPIHHLEGHLLAPMLEATPPALPYLALLVSGGHTQLIEVTAIGQYRLLGETMDDAAGEAFDKTAKLLGLGFPGGPALAKAAATGNPGRFRLPYPLAKRDTLDFSFSGLKTAVRLLVERQTEFTEQDRADLARDFEERVTDVLAERCAQALRHCGAQTLVVAGGVGANQRLREKLQRLTADGITLCFPAPHHCTDNAAMIALAGYLRRSEAQPAGAIAARARWPLEQLQPVAI